jgi:hypothetical protein
MTTDASFQEPSADELALSDNEGHAAAAPSGHTLAPAAPATEEDHQEAEPQLHLSLISSAAAIPQQANDPNTPPFYQQIFEGGSPTLAPFAAFNDPTSWPPSGHHVDQSDSMVDLFDHALDQAGQQQQHSQVNGHQQQQMTYVLESSIMQPAELQMDYHQCEEQQLEQGQGHAVQASTAQYEGHSHVVPEHEAVTLSRLLQQGEEHICFMQPPLATAAACSNASSATAIRRSHSLPPLRFALAANTPGASAATANQQQLTAAGVPFDQAVAGALHPISGSSSFHALSGGSLQHPVGAQVPPLLRHQTLPPGVYMGHQALAPGVYNQPHPLPQHPQQQQQQLLQPPSQWWGQTQLDQGQLLQQLWSTSPGEEDQQLQPPYAGTAAERGTQGASEALAQQLMPPGHASPPGDEVTIGVTNMSSFYFVDALQQQQIGGEQQGGSPAVAAPNGVSPVVSPVGDQSYTMVTAGDGPALEDTELFLVTESRASAAVAALNAAGGGLSPDSIDALPTGAR